VTPSRDEFGRWREDFVTQWVMQAHKAAAEANKAGWIEGAWATGVASQGALNEVRTRSDAYLAIVDSSYEAFCDMLEQEPRDA
jgi:hypothetical protein